MSKRNLNIIIIFSNINIIFCLNQNYSKTLFSTQQCNKGY